MKRLLCILLALLTLCGCGAQGSAVEPSATERAYTEEERFLQEAYWYLQFDEKEILSWENGVMEDFCAEERREVISPEGLTDIQGRALRRVYYPLSYITEHDYELVSLYFDPDGSFVGTDYSVLLNGTEELRTGGLWNADLNYWLFLEKKEMPLDGTQTATCVLRNTGQKKTTVTAYAPKIMAVSWYQNGKSRGSGLAAAAQEITLRPGEVYVETQNVIPEGWNEHNWMPYTPGMCTVVSYVPLSQEAGGMTVTLSKSAAFTITE